jgi:hypothetical protein
MKGNPMKSETERRADAVVVSERAKQQIGSQASNSKTQLQSPNFLESFSDFGDTAPAANLATVHWKI